MDFDSFASAADFANAESELHKAELIAFFLLREERKTAFEMEDLSRLWQLVPVHQPNLSRLQKKMTASGSFPKAPKGGFRLLESRVREWEATLGSLWIAKPKLLRSGGPQFVHDERLIALRALVGAKPDPRRLVRLCEEINLCHDLGCTMAVALLIRTVINHVPPALGLRTFAEVSNNYGGDPKTNKSFKKIASKLEEVARNIGDRIAHETMRDVEGLPTATQIDFSQELDVLLEEVVRALQAKSS
jgi:hypothetical protein